MPQMAKKQNKCKNVVNGTICYVNNIEKADGDLPAVERMTRGL